MNDLNGKVAVVTGSASGIGRETAVRLAAAGVHVVHGDLNRSGGEETSVLCDAAGRQSAFLTTDVSRETDIAALVGLAADRFGGVDILFNNAGSGGVVGPIETITVEDWDRTQNILLRSVFLGIKHVVPAMRARGGGAIISSASIAAHRGYAGLHGYCAAKAGVVNLTRSAAVELGPSRIRVNCICPGSVLTPMHHIRGDAEALERELASHQPIGRAGYPRDIAEAVLYFASDAAAWVTGVSLDVDGGRLSGVWTHTPSSKPPERGFLGPSFTYASGDLMRP